MKSYWTLRDNCSVGHFHIMVSPCLVEQELKASFRFPPHPSLSIVHINVKKMEAAFPFRIERALEPGDTRIRLPSID